MKNSNQTINKSLVKRGLIALSIVSVPFTSFSQEAASAPMSESTTGYILIAMLVLQIALLSVIAGVFKSLTNNSGIWKKLIDSKKGAAILTGVMLLSGTDVFAQGGLESFSLDAGMENLLIALNGFLLLIIFMLLWNVKKIISALKGEEEEVIEPDVFVSFGLTDAVPLEKESDILLDHDYDGIHELDNNLPPWWLYGFYITGFWAILYMFYYLKADNIDVGQQLYASEMQQAAEEAELRGSLVDESTVELLTSESDLAIGKEIFTTNCVVCHLASGGGSVGPNLTDEFWIHGGGIKNVFRTVKVGVPEKGMISWENSLSPTDMQKVSSYVISLQGTNPADGKAAEGDIWTE